jgi:hypothetical protein
MDADSKNEKVTDRLATDERMRARAIEAGTAVLGAARMQDVERGSRARWRRSAAGGLALGGRMRATSSGGCCERRAGRRCAYGSGARPQGGGERR